MTRPETETRRDQLAISELIGRRATDSPDRALQRVAEQCGAQAAVVCVDDGVSAVSVARSWPTGLLAAGTNLPDFDKTTTGAVVRDAEHLAALVPPILKRRLPSAPTAAQAIPLGDSRGFLLLTWSDAAIGHTLSELQPIGKNLEDPRRLQAGLDARYRRLMDDSIIATSFVLPEGRFLLFNDAMCELLGYDADTLRQMTWQDLTAPDDLEQGLAVAADMLSGRRDSARFIKRYRHKDGHLISGDVLLTCLRAPDGHAESIIAQIVDITGQVQAREQLEQNRRRHANIDARCQRLMENSIVPTSLTTSEGRFVLVNNAMCTWLGYDAETMLQLDWQILTPQDYLAADLPNVEDMLAGRQAAYRVTKPFIRSDGRRIWGDVLASCLRNSDGTVEHLITQVVDVTDEVESRQQLAQREEQNRVLAENLQLQTDRLQFELDSAANYVASILPRELDGPMSVSSRYLPSRTLGGDCYDYRWIDDDHLIVNLFDVSGHGVEAALLAVSIHNLIRSGTLSADILRSPERVLTELNRLFPMDDHGGHYFTLWYGVYQPSTRILSFASAGHPPALVLPSPGADPIELFTPAAPIGMFDDSEFHTATYQVPPNAQILIYSDGAFELALHDGNHWSLTEFVSLFARLAGSPDWSLDTVVDHLHKLQPGGFTDDCSLIKLDFP